MLTVFIYVIVAVLGVFVLAGIILLGTALIRGGRTGHGPTHPEEAGVAEQSPGIRGTLHRYVGPVERRHALLNAPARIAVEFAAALCGFPGLGWLISGKVITGLVLLVVGPSFVWGALPAYLVVSGRIAGDPYLAVRYLPVLAVVSAAALTAYHLRLTRAEQGEHVGAEG